MSSVLDEIPDKRARRKNDKRLDSHKTKKEKRETRKKEREEIMIMTNGWIYVYTTQSDKRERNDYTYTSQEPRQKR